MATHKTPQPQHPPRQQSGAVAALAVTLAVLVTIWIVGAVLLIRYAPHLGELPQTSPSSETPPGR